MNRDAIKILLHPQRSLDVHIMNAILRALFSNIYS